MIVGQFSRRVVNRNWYHALALESMTETTVCVHLPSCSCLQTVSEKIFCSEPKSTVGGGGEYFFCRELQRIWEKGEPLFC